MTVRQAHAGDRSTAAVTLARAFADDPAMTYIFPDPIDRSRRLPRLFALLFDSDAAGMRWVGDAGTGATLWRPPGSPAAGTFEMLCRALPLLSAFGPNLIRALRVNAAITGHFPAEPFFYLHVAGVDPLRQGEGLGTALIRAGLARSDAAGLPVVLETATMANVDFYRRLGFDVIAEWTVPGGGGLQIWTMRRPSAAQ